MKKRIKQTSGLTLIELMISLAIASMLAVIAIPAYTNYMQKAKVSEGYIMLQKMVHGVYANFGTMAQVLQNDELYVGESRNPAGALILLSQAIRIDGTRYRTLAPLPTKKNNFFRLRRNNTCYNPDDAEKRCGSILVQNMDYLQSLGFPMREQAAADQYSTNTSYFIPSIRSSTALANALIADGYPALYRKRNSFNTDIYQSSLLTVMADLDGDGDINNDAYRNAAQNSANISLHSNLLTYFSRALYVDQNTGELKSTPGIIKENVGE